MATLEFENGVFGQWVSTNVAPGDGFHHSAIYGSEGSIVWGKGLKNRSEELTMEALIAEHEKGLTSEESEKFFPGGVRESCGSELWEFVQAVKTGSALETDGTEGLKALAICMAVYESAHGGRPVDIAAIEALEIEDNQSDLNAAAGV